MRLLILLLLVLPTAMAGTGAAASSAASVVVADPCGELGGVGQHPEILTPDAINICAATLTATATGDGTVLTATVTVAGDIRSTPSTRYSMRFGIGEDCTVGIAVRDTDTLGGDDAAIFQHSCEGPQFISTTNFDSDWCPTRGLLRDDVFSSCQGREGEWVGIDEHVTIEDGTLTVDLDLAELLAEDDLDAFAPGRVLEDYEVEAVIRADGYGGHSEQGTGSVFGTQFRLQTVSDRAATTDDLIIPAHDGADDS